MAYFKRGPKTVDELTFTDNGMFQAVLREPGVCAELVERLLGVRVKKVEYPELEKTIAPYYATKGVRLDVYLKDEDKIIDVEIQNYKQYAIGKRMRFYQSMIDSDSLVKGDDYTELKESYILFVCAFDPFKDEKGKPFGLSRYTFRSACEENNFVKLDDKSLKVVYNASAYERERDEKVKAFLRFAYTNDPGADDYSKRLAAIVEKLKANENFRQEYAAMNIHDMDLIRESKKEQVEEIARNALAMNLPEEQVAQITGLSIEEIHALASAGNQHLLSARC